ncbi:MAG: 2Fe-2S iron-sulfur cluster-binding protein [Thermosulfidibacteraceae bacterium]
MARITIDGIAVEVRDDATILEAARKAGIDIPYFCYHPYLKPAGLCRMCLVEVEGMPKLTPACVTQVRDGMVVRTDTPRVKKAREGIIEFQLLHHPLDCPYCDQAGECMLQDITYRYGRATSRFVDEKELFPTKFYGPFIVYEQSRCILCKRCVRFTHEYMAGTDWNVYFRAAHSLIGTYENKEIADYFTCNLVEICPVGAITSRLYRYKVRYWTLEWARGVCRECGLFCSLDYGIRENKAYRAKHNVNSPGPWICDKGYFGFECMNHPERIKFALERRENKLVNIGLEKVLNGITQALGRYKPEEVAFILPSDLSVEDAAGIRNFMDNFGIKKAEYRVGMEDYLPFGSNVDSLEEISEARNILVLSGDISNSYPVIALTICEAIGKGANVVLLTSWDYYLMKRVNNLFCIKPSCEDGAIYSLFSGKWDEFTGLSREEYERLEAFLQTKPMIVLGPRAQEAVRALIVDYAIKNGLKYIILDRSSSSYVAYTYGLFCKGIDSLLEEVKAGSVKALFVLGVDLFREVPNGKLVRDALGSVDFMVYMGLFFNGTARYADYFLPLTELVEEEAHFVNVFGKLTKSKKSLAREYEERSIREWLKLISEKMGKKLDLEVREFKPKFVLVEGNKKPKDIVLSGSGDFEALFEIPFYRNFRYMEGKSKLLEASPEPVLNVSIYDARSLGLSNGDYVSLDIGGPSFKYKIRVFDELVKGVLVADTGFEGFPVNEALNNRIAKVKIKK